MFKRLICGFCMMVMLCSFIPATAEDHVCSMMPTDNMTLEWSIDDTYHQKNRLRQYYCSFCSETCWNVDAVVVPKTTHSYDLTSDWHVVSTHYYNWYCGICGDTQISKTNCPGPPCPIVLSRTPSPEYGLLDVELTEADDLCYALFRIAAD